MPRPQLFMCYLCGQEYGSKSLPIHIPQCQAKFKAIEAQKPKRERRKMPQPPPGYMGGMFGGGGPSDGRATTTAGRSSAFDNEVVPAARQQSPVDLSTLTLEERQGFNESAYEQYNNVSLIACEHCGRTFSDTALRIHQKSCTADKPAKRAGTGLSPAARSGPAYGGGRNISPAKGSPPRKTHLATTAPAPTSATAATAAGGGQPSGLQAGGRARMATTSKAGAPTTFKPELPPPSSAGGGAEPAAAAEPASSPPDGEFSFSFEGGGESRDAPLAGARPSIATTAPLERPQTASGFAPPNSFDDFVSKSKQLKSMVDAGVLSQAVFDKWQATYLGVTF